MSSESLYVYLALVVFFMNTFPAFMPPTWIVLAFFYMHFHSSFLPTVLIGAICATLGRVTLAFLAKYYFRPFLPKSFYKNYTSLGTYFRTHQHFTIPFVFL